MLCQDANTRRKKIDQNGSQLLNSRNAYSKMPFSKESEELTKSCEHKKMKKYD